MNLLATHLSIIDKNLTYEFVSQLSSLIQMFLHSLSSGDDSHTEDLYHAIKTKIPKVSKPANELESLLLPFGFNLLLELTYLFLLQCKSDVIPSMLRQMIIQEFMLILDSLVKAESLFQEEVQVDRGVLRPIADSHF